MYTTVQNEWVVRLFKCFLKMSLLLIKASNNSNIVKYYNNLKYYFSILIYFKIYYCIPNVFRSLVSHDPLECSKMLIWFPRIYFILSSMLKTFVLVNITILLLIESQKEHNLFERDIFSNSVKASTFNLAEWKYYYKKIKEQKTYPKILNGRECHQKTLNIVWISLWYFLSFLELKSILCFTEERNLYITRW